MRSTIGRRFFTMRVFLEPITFLMSQLIIWDESKDLRRATGRRKPRCGASQPGHAFASHPERSVAKRKDRGGGGESWWPVKGEPPVEWPATDAWFSPHLGVRQDRNPR